MWKSALFILLSLCVASPLPILHPTAAQGATDAAVTSIEDQEIFYDQYGLIVHKRDDGTFDGGDTAQREGWYWLGVWLRQNIPGQPPWSPQRALTFDQVLTLLEPNHDGVFYRHPKQAPFNNPHDKEWGFSRDQMLPLVAAMGVWGKHDAIRRLWEALPEDLLGKHSFNGNWRNFLGQDGPNCGSIKARDCSPEGDCSLQVDTRDCSLQVDTRDCSLQVDTRDCSLQVDTRSCGHDIDALFGKVHINDPICEAAKAAQNAGYALAKTQCEAAKSGQNVAYAAAKTQCETEKVGQNAAYAAAKATCESAKVGKNAEYAAAKATCETAKTTKKMACEVDKQAAYQTCRISNVHSGDLIGPQHVNLFLRALNQNPLTPLTEMSGATVIQGGASGEAELLVNAHLRVGQSHKDRGDVGDDLNQIVMLIMAKIRFPTPISEEASRVYREQRAQSYGSYLGRYYAEYGDDMKDVKSRIEAGIANGWSPDVSSAYGAVRWYHRPETGANPRLALLYSTFLDQILK